MRNVYLGTSDFAVSVLEALLDSPHAPSLVVTRPPRQKGRGKKLHDPPVAIFAKQRGVALFQPESVNDDPAVARIEAERPEALTVCAFGAIVKQPLLGAQTSFNVHPSLLPRWRGAAPIERAIQAGDQSTGVTIMSLVEELDAGPLCAQQAVAIGEHDDYGSLAPRLAELGGRLLVDSLDQAQAGGLDWRDQLAAADESSVTYAEKIERADRLLHPREQSARELALTVRALNPHVGALLELASGDPLRVFNARVEPAEMTPGSVRAESGRLLIGTTEMTLELLRVQPAGGKPMDVESFLRGNDAPELA